MLAGPLGAQWGEPAGLWVWGDGPAPQPLAVRGPTPPAVPRRAIKEVTPTCGCEGFCSGKRVPPPTHCWSQGESERLSWTPLSAQTLLGGRGGGLGLPCPLPPAAQPRQCRGAWPGRSAGREPSRKLPKPTLGGGVRGFPTVAGPPGSRHGVLRSRAQMPARRAPPGGAAAPLAVGAGQELGSKPPWWPAAPETAPHPSPLPPPHPRAPRGQQEAASTGTWRSGREEGWVPACGGGKGHPG